MWVQVFVLGWNLKQTVAPFNEILLESGVDEKVHYSASGWCSCGNALTDSSHLSQFHNQIQHPSFKSHSLCFHYFCTALLVFILCVILSLVLCLIIQIIMGI